MREGLRLVLERAGFTIVGDAADAPSLLDRVRELQPDLVVTDIRMPPTHTDEGLRAAARIRAEHPDIAVMVLSAYVAEAYVPELLDSAPGGGVGYLLKDRVAEPAEFVRICERVADGGTALDPEVVAQLLSRGRRGSGAVLADLTPREHEVLSLMAEGRSNRGIAAQLVVTAGAVEKHITNILGKLDLPDSPEDHRRVLAVLALMRSAAE